eukprot:CFRG8300T1
MDLSPADKDEVLATFKEITHETNNFKCKQTLDVYDWDLEGAIDGFLTGGHAYDVSAETGRSGLSEVDPTLNIQNNSIPHTIPIATPFPRSNLHTTVPQHSANGAGWQPMGGTVDRSGSAWTNARAQGLRSRLSTREYVNGNMNIGASSGEVGNDARQPRSWLSWAITLIFAPFDSVVRAVDYFFGPFLRAVISFSRSLVEPELDVDAATLARNFETEFNEKYGIRHPPFFYGSYVQAMRKAKEELKFLVVYIHSPRHEDTDEFCKNYLSNQEVMDLCYGANSVLYAAMTNTSEGWGTALSLQATGYPFVGVILPTESKWKLVGTIEEISSVKLFIDQLRALSEMANAELVLHRNERQERQMAQQLRFEQDHAFKESLKADKEKDEQKLTRDRLRKEEEERKQIEIDEEKRKAEALELKRKSNFEALPKEPAKGESETTSISFKLPEGQRLQRRFRFDDKVKHLYDFVAGYHLEYDVPDEFLLVCTFPRQEYSDQNQTLREAKLTDSVALMVHDQD